MNQLRCLLADEAVSALRVTRLVLAKLELTAHSQSALPAPALRRLSVGLETADAMPRARSCEMRRLTWLASVPKRAVLTQMIQAQLI